MASGIQGTVLEIIVVGCAKLKNAKWGWTQEPYAILQYSGTKFRTKTCKDGGTDPSFNEKFAIFLVEGVREIDISVWIKHRMTSDTFIGSGRIHLFRVLSEGYDDMSWMLESNNAKFAGEVHIIMHYGPAKGKNSANPQATIECQEIARPPMPSLYPSITLEQLIACPTPTRNPYEVPPYCLHQPSYEQYRDFPPNPPQYRYIYGPPPNYEPPPESTHNYLPMYPPEYQAHPPTSIQRRDYAYDFYSTSNSEHREYASQSRFYEPSAPSHSGLYPSIY